jgi:hypothetical protein
VDWSKPVFPDDAADVPDLRLVIGLPFLIAGFGLGVIAI